MKPFVLLLSATLAQEPPAPHGGGASDTPSVAEKPGPPSDVEPPLAPEEARPAIRQPKGADEVVRRLKRLRDLPAAERAGEIMRLREDWGGVEVNPILPPPDVDLGRYVELDRLQQARVTARQFFRQLVAADSTAMLAQCGLPFMLEGRRIERATDLRTEWVKSLKAKRTDLLVLYDVELLTGAEMERKYGAPPRRLSSWGWRSSEVLLGVGNLSGHATVLLLRQVGAAWQIVGFHD